LSMKVDYLPVVFMLAAGLALAGCAGDGAQGPAGPRGEAGSPQPVKVLIAGAHEETVLKSCAAKLVGYGLYPMGTEVNYVNVGDSVPPLDVFSRYDAVLLYSNDFFTHADSVGDILADYVDGGGGVVVCLACLYTSGLPDDFAIKGRIMEEGYCPFEPAGASLTAAGRIDAESVDVPLHPIFNGVDIFNLTYAYNPIDPDPPLNAWGVLLASDINGNNRVAVNTAGNVAGVVIFPPNQFLDATTYPEAQQLLANATLFVAGAY